MLVSTMNSEMPSKSNAWDQAKLRLKDQISYTSMHPFFCIFISTMITKSRHSNLITCCLVENYEKQNLISLQNQTIEIQSQFHKSAILQPDFKHMPSIVSNFYLKKKRRSFKMYGKSLTQDPNTQQFLELCLTHGKLHPLQVLRDQNLKPLHACYYREEYCWFSNPGEWLTEHSLYEGTLCLKQAKRAHEWIH